MHARAPLFSSHVQAYNKVLVYKLKKKTLSLFHVGHNFLFLFLLKKLIVYNTIHLPHQIPIEPAKALIQSTN